jgi:hypothetical protein
MEPSPLTQQARPEIFQQKVVSLYEELFKVGVHCMELGIILTWLRMRKTLRSQRASGKSSSC